MSLKLEAPIATARSILNDPAGVRYSDSDLLQYANDALDQMTGLVPSVFYADGDLTCVPTKAMQSVSCADALSLAAIKRVKNGRAVLPTTKDVLDAYDPDWQSSTPAAAVNWMPSIDDPLRFFIYPPAPDGQILEISYVRIPPEFASGDTTMVPAKYSDAISDYIVHRAESRDDEYVNTGRAAQFLQSFIGKVKGA